MKNARFFFLLFLFAFGLSACQSFKTIVEEPAVSLNSVDVAGIGLHGVDLVVHIDVENPNAFSVPFPKVDWELFINAASFIKGSLPSGQSIRSRETVTLDFPVSFTYEGLYGSFKSLIQTKEAAYNIAMGLSFPLPVIESKTYNLNFSGVVPLPQLPEFSPSLAKVTKIDFSGIDLAWDIVVENPNVFPIPAPRIDWRYDINDSPILTGALIGSGEIPAGASGVGRVTASVVYADVFNAVHSLRDAIEAKGLLFLSTENPIKALSDITRILEVPGAIPILHKPEISFRGIERKSLGATMEFVLNWEVDNKNNFEFDIGEFVYDFKVNDSRWASGAANNPPRIKANGKTLIPITVSVSALSLVRELVDIINRGAPVNYSCAGNMALLSAIPIPISGLEKIELPLNLQGSSTIR